MSLPNAAWCCCFTLSWLYKTVSVSLRFLHKLEYFLYLFQPIKVCKETRNFWQLWNYFHVKFFFSFSIVRSSEMQFLSAHGLKCFVLILYNLSHMFLCLLMKAPINGARKTSTSSDPSVNLHMILLCVTVWYFGVRPQGAMRGGVIRYLACYF